MAWSTRNVPNTSWSVRAIVSTNRYNLKDVNGNYVKDVNGNQIIVIGPSVSGTTWSPRTIPT